MALSLSNNAQHLNNDYLNIVYNGCGNFIENNRKTYIIILFITESTVWRLTYIALVLNYNDNVIWYSALIKYVQTYYNKIIIEIKCVSTTIAIYEFSELIIFNNKNQSNTYIYINYKY